MRTSGTSGRRPALRRVVFALAVVASVIAMQPSTGTAQSTGGGFQARLCNTLRQVQARFGDSPQVRQALNVYLARFGCTPGQPTTSVATTTTTIFGTTTTFVPPTTTTLPGGTTVPTTSTTLPPCPTTTTSPVPTSFPPTTIPCLP